MSTMYQCKNKQINVFRFNLGCLFQATCYSSLVPRPRPAFRRLRYGLFVCGESLGTRLLLLYIHLNKKRYFCIPGPPISFPCSKSHSHAPSLIPMSPPDCWCGGTACYAEGAHCSPFSASPLGNRGHSRHGGWLEETIWPHATTFRYTFLSNYTHTTLPCNIENAVRVPIGQCS